MLIAHLPAGYILAKKLFKNFKSSLLSKQFFFIAILSGAIFPDLDLFYFYFIDAKSVHHHYYFFHWPIIYLALLLIGSILYFFKSTPIKRLGLISCLFALAALLHLLLDTFVGDVWLFMPFIDRSYAMFQVPDVQSHWMLNFILHWSFLVEIFICIYSARLFFKR